MSAAYPFTSFSLGSERALISGRRVDMADDGTPRGLSLHTSPTYRFTLRHQRLSSANAATLDAFYSTNINAEIALTWTDGNNYTCIFGPAGANVTPNGVHWHAEVELIGRAA